MGTQRSWRPPSGSTASGRRVLRVPAEAIAEARGDARPGGARRAGGVDPPRPPGPRRPAPHRRAPPRSCPAARSPSAGCRSTGSACTCPAAWPSTRRSVVMNVVPAQVAGRRARSRSPARRSRRTAACRTPRSSPPARCSASTRCTRSAAPRRSRCSATATATAVPARRSTWSPARATSTSPPPSGCSRGVVGIDAEAGPTEIAILADDTADPVHVAADLISQAEHDPLAAACWSPTSTALADAVEAELDRQVAGDQARRAGHRRRWPASSPPSCWSTTSTQGLRVVDAYARRAPGDPDRATPRRSGARVRNAGAIFVGPCAPVSLGDYVAGSNHVLPTGGCARHSSGLSVQSFLRGIHVVDYDARRAAPRSPPTWSRSPTPRTCRAHGAAVQARFAGSPTT